MRRRLAIVGLAVAFLSTMSEGAEVTVLDGWTLSRIPHGLTTPSGGAYDGDDLLLTDLEEGRVIRMAPDGTATVLARELPAGRDVMGEPTGPYKVQVRNGRVYVTQGWQDVNREEGPLDHAVIEISSSTGARVLSDDFWNPYDFAWGGDGWYVADAARNTLARLSLDGSVNEVFAFHDIQRTRSALSVLSPTEFKGEEAYEVDAVPTGVAVRGDRVFVSLFGGFPYLVGSGLVVSVPTEDARRARLELRDLDAPIDVAFDAAGRLLVLELGRFDLAAERFSPGSGRLSRVDLADGSSEVLAEGLSRPVTVVPGDDGSVVVVQMSGGILRFLPPN